MIGFPFDSHVEYDADGVPIFDRAITSEPYRKLLKELFKTGVMPNPSSNMQVAAGTEMNVIVNPGFAMVEGCMKLEEEARTLAVQASDSSYDRIDTVVLRLDDNDAVRECDFYIIKGVAAASPVRPTLTREGSIYEIGLADLYITKNSSSISNSKITDTRYEVGRCGVVSSISEFDTTTLDQQINAWTREQQIEFAAWVESIKDILDENVAAHILSLLNAHIEDNVRHVSEADRQKWDNAGINISGDVTATLTSITASTTDITAGTTTLATGQLYVVYE